MPTYEYICENCACKFEQFQPIKAKPIRKCPKCGKRELKRLIGSGSGVIFKGSGFHQTDYRSESYKKGEKSEKTKTKSKDAKPSEKTKPGTKNKKKST